MSQRIFAYLFYLLPHHAISWLMFKLARIENTTFKNFAIRVYTKLNTVNMSEALIENKYDYSSLNAFFTRELKKEARPFEQNNETWICPVDGAVSQAGPISKGNIFQAKGHSYSLRTLLGGDDHNCKAFENGQFATLYLSPRDYHRIHMPVKGTLTKMTYIPGRLFSVAENTVNHIPGLFARNERCVCQFETSEGPMVMVLVGAINVSAIETIWHGLVNPADNKMFSIEYATDKIVLDRGEEMGRFNLGSTVIVITGPEMTWDTAIKPGNTIKLGQALCAKSV